MTPGHRSIFISVTCLGMSSLITQIVTLREFLNILAGNELIIGLILSNWLLLTGLGSYLGRFADRLQRPIRWLTVLQVGVAFLPFLQTSAIRLLKTRYVAGLMLDLHQAFFYSFLLLLPYCLVSGFLLTLFSSLGGNRKDAAQIGDIYVYDVAGDILGGALFSFLLIYLFNPFQVFTFLLVLNLGGAFLVSYSHQGSIAALPYAAILTIALVVISFYDLEKITGQSLFPGQEILYQESTPYGNLAVTRSEKQFTVYENGIPVGSSEDVIAAEESTHFALSQHEAPEKVLLVSGGLNGALQGVLKYPLTKIDYVELDPAIIRLVQKLFPRSIDDRVTFIAEDARHHIRSSALAYDAILIDLADPATAQLNRFYTLEFFQAARQALSPSGILSFGLSGAENFANPEIRYLSSTVYRSLKEVFPHILIVPGTRQYYIAGANQLDYEISAKLAVKNIRTEYVNQSYLKARLTDDRLALANQMVSVPAPLNVDFRPAAYYAQLRFWLSKFQTSLLLPIALACAITVLGAVLILQAPKKAAPFALTLSGFSGIGLEIIILLSFQIIYGYVYQQIGILFTAFLLGTALGASWTVRSSISGQKLFFLLEISFVLVSLLLVPVLLVMQSSLSPLLYKTGPLILFPFLTICVGFLVGAQFPVAAGITFHGVAKTAGILYSLDFLGAALGALLVSAFAIPMLGIFNTCYLIAAIKLVSSLVFWLKRREQAREVDNVLRTGASSRVVFVTVLLVFSGTGFLVFHDSTSMPLYSMSFYGPYHWLLLGLLAVGLLRAMQLLPSFALVGLWPGIDHELFRRTRIGILRWVYFFSFSLLIFSPIFRCYFKIPYLFCHVCPRQCAFGFLRPYLVPAALIMNFEKRHWCFQCCPIGTFLDCQARVSPRPARLPRLIKVMPILVLLFTAVTYFRTANDLQHAPSGAVDWYTYFFKNVFSPAPIVIGTAALMILLAFKYRRSFCELLCPIGTLSDLLLKTEQLPFQKKSE